MNKKKIGICVAIFVIVVIVICIVIVQYSKHDLEKVKKEYAQTLENME